MKSAVELQRMRGLDYVFVQLMFDSKAMSAGWAAEAEYAPDGFDQSGETKLRNGTWEASVSPLASAEDALTIYRAWDEHKESFRNAEGLLDEPKLKAKIAKATGATLEAIDATLLEYGLGQPLTEYSPP